MASGRLHVATGGSAALPTHLTDVKLCVAVLQEHAKSLREQHSAWRSAKAAAPQSEIAWTGLGSDLPAQVEGLRNVHSVSLGGVHALAVVDDE